MRNDIVIGFIILVVLLGGAYLLRRPSQPPQAPSVSNEIEEVERDISEKFNVDIPEDVEKSALSDVTGGNSSAIATKQETDGQFVYTILADLPDLESGNYYGWFVPLEDGEFGYEGALVGTMRQAKGGWLLELESNENIGDNARVIVSTAKSADNTPENIVLEGSFK